MPPNLKEIEEKILDYMVEYLRTNTYQPTIREIGERFGIKSTKTVSEHLKALASKGFLERDPSRSRGARILGVDLHPQAVSVPCYSRLPVEPPRGAQAGRAELRLTIDKRLAGATGCFFVRAGKDDLVSLGISEGDFVLVEPASAHDLEEGAIIVARLSDSSSFFRYAKNGEGALLHPARAGEPPTAIEEVETLSLIGRVAAFYRRVDGRPIPVSATTH